MWPPATYLAGVTMTNGGVMDRIPSNILALSEHQTELLDDARTRAPAGKFHRQVDGLMTSGGRPCCARPRDWSRGVVDCAAPVTG